MPDLGALLVQADARHLPLRDESVQCVVTSPPYWGLRDYGAVGQLGLEASPEEYVERMVEVMREVRRVLRDDGTLWLNLGDSYANASTSQSVGSSSKSTLTTGSRNGAWAPGSDVQRFERPGLPNGIPAKSLIGIPWRVALALIDDGWVLRSDIIWHKPMPESVRDRPTKAHEYLFLLTKGPRYFYDADAVREQASDNPVSAARRNRADFGAVGTVGLRGTKQGQSGKGANAEHKGDTRNKRDVWTVATRGYKGAHFATFPPALIEPCILAGSRPGDVVLDPFNGSGTTGRVALRLGRSYVGTDISREYLAEQAVRRLDGVQMEAAL